MMKRFMLGAVAVCAAIAWTGMAHASLINVKFDGNYTGQAATGASGDYWNSVGSGLEASGATGTGIELKDSAQGTTTVKMDYTAGDMWDEANNAFKSTTLAGLMNGFLYANSSWDNTSVKTISIALKGLTPGKYDLYLYSATNTTDRVLTFTATTSVNTTGVSTVIGPCGDGATLKQSTLSVYDPKNTTPSNYGVVEVEVGSNGLLNIVSTVNSGESDLNGFQLKSVPEPTSMAMLIGGGLCLVAYAWRKRRK